MLETETCTKVPYNVGAVVSRLHKHILLFFKLRQNVLGLRSLFGRKIAKLILKYVYQGTRNKRTKLKFKEHVFQFTKVFGEEILMGLLYFIRFLK